MVRWGRNQINAAAIPRLADGSGGVISRNIPIFSNALGGRVNLVGFGCAICMREVAWGSSGSNLPNCLILPFINRHLILERLYFTPRSDTVCCWYLVSVTRGLLGDFDEDCSVPRVV